MACGLPACGARYALARAACTGSHAESQRLALDHARAQDGRTGVLELLFGARQATSADTPSSASSSRTTTGGGAAAVEWAAVGSLSLGSACLSTETAGASVQPRAPAAAQRCGAP